jgi:hypothetical protein
LSPRVRDQPGQYTESHKITANQAQPNFQSDSAGLWRDSGIRIFAGTKSKMGTTQNILRESWLRRPCRRPNVSLLTPKTQLSKLGTLLGDLSTVCSQSWAGLASWTM